MDKQAIGVLASTLLRAPLALAAEKPTSEFFEAPTYNASRRAAELPSVAFDPANEELARHMGVADDVRINVRPDMLGGGFLPTAILSGDERDDMASEMPLGSVGTVLMEQNPTLALAAHELGHAVRQKKRGKFWRKHHMGVAKALKGLSLVGALGATVLGRKGAGRLAKLLVKRPGALKRIGEALSKKNVGRLAGLGVGGGTAYLLNKPLLSEERGASELANKAIKELYGREQSKATKKRTDEWYKTYKLEALKKALPGILTGIV